MDPADERKAGAIADLLDVPSIAILDPTLFMANLRRYGRDPSQIATIYRHNAARVLVFLDAHPEFKEQTRRRHLKRRMRLIDAANAIDLELQYEKAR